MKASFNFQKTDRSVSEGTPGTWGQIRRKMVDVCVCGLLKSVCDASSLGLCDIVDFVKDINTLSSRDLRGKHNTNNWETGLTV